MSIPPSLVHELHRRIHAKPRPPRYEPVPVRELLQILNKYLRKFVELGTYGYLSKDDVVLLSIVDLEHRLDEYSYQLLLHMSIAVSHDIHDVWKATPIYMYVFSVDKVMDAFKDLASLALHQVHPSPRLQNYVAWVSDVVTAKIRGAKLPYNRFELLRSEYGIDIVAVYRGGDWVLDTARGEIKKHDVLYVRGPKDNVKQLFIDSGTEFNEGTEPPPRAAQVLRTLDTFLDMVLLLNDLAHYQLLAQDPLLGDELLELESYIDSLRISLVRELIVLEDLDAVDRLALLNLVTRLEDVADALTYITMLPAQDEYRDIIAEIFEASDEKLKLFIARSSVPVDKLMKLAEDLGIVILAVKRERVGEWVAATPVNIRSLKIDEGDRILVSYSTSIEREVFEQLRSIGLEPSTSP